MKKRNIVLLICLLTAGTFCLFASAQQEQKALADKLVRLHVVAHSDEEADQAEKLLVRDAVLAVTEPLAARLDDPRGDLALALPEIQKAAETCLRSLGSSREVRVSLGRERFPTRYYETFALPAGVYPSLRVTIGAGEGRNWWCVAFPSICLRATAAELEDAAVSAGFAKEEVKLITEENTGYVLKFKIWELLGEWKGRFFDSAEPK